MVRSDDAREVASRYAGHVVVDLRRNDLQRFALAWYATGDASAYRDAWTLLDQLLYARPEIRRVLDEDAIRDARLAAITRLLDREAKRLAAAEDVIKFARRELEYRLRDAIRRTIRRKRLLPIADGELEHAPSEPAEALEPAADNEPDVVQMRHLLAAMPFNRRMALLLTFDPRRIDDDDWRELAERGDTRERPAEPVDVDRASALIWPPHSPEDEKERANRLARCRRERSRAIASVQKLWRKE